MYPLYDITSSAFTSPNNSKFLQSKEANNPYRVVPSAVLDQNFMKHVVCGDMNNRIDNKIAWE